MSGIDKVLEGPFTYEMDKELSLRYDEDDEIPISAKDQPVIALMYALMKIYIFTVKEDYEEAEKKILELDEMWKNLDMRRITAENISVQVLQHIKDSTLYYFNSIKLNKKLSDEIFQKITDSRTLKSNIELATFHGCRAICWSIFHEAGQKQALIIALQATAHRDDCPLWHFVLYKNYRISRRKLDFHSIPSNDEMKSILTCIKLSNDAYYCLHAGQMYREAKNSEKALVMFRKVHDSKPESCGILLKLALGMLRCYQRDVARQLLNQVEKKYPNDTMFLHYKGLYLETLKKYEEAIDYYARAAKSYNYPADLQYACCRLKFDKNFDCVAHLRMMIKKYKGEAHAQQLLLHLGMQYFKKDDFTEACKSFLKAIQMNKDSNQLKMFNNCTVDYKTQKVDIFDFINLELVPRCDSVDSVVLKQLSSLCS